MEIPLINIFILFIYLVVTNAIPIAPSDSHPLARREQRDHLEILFVSEDDQSIRTSTPDGQFELDIQEIERKYQDKKNLLVPSDATATNQMLHTLSARLDNYVELDEGWYKNSVHVIASGVDLVSQLEKHPSNDLDLNTRILITNFLIYLESAIERMTWEKLNQLEALHMPPFGPMLGYLQQKLQIFVKFTESRPKARLTFDEMDAELEKVYRGRFKTRYGFQLQIRRIQGVLPKVKKATSMTWEFRMLEVAHLIGQLSQLESANDVLGIYIEDIRKGLEELNKRHVENSTVGVRGTCRPGDDEKLKTYLERLREGVEQQQQQKQQKLPTAVGSPTSAGQKKRPFEQLDLDAQLVHRPKKPSGPRQE